MEQPVPAVPGTSPGTEAVREAMEQSTLHPVQIERREVAAPLTPVLADERDEHAIAREQTSDGRATSREAEQDMKTGDVFVVVEHDKGELKEVTLELLGDARVLATKMSGKVWAIVLTNSMPDVPQWVSSQLAEHGADRVLLVEHELLDPYVAEAYVEVLSQLSRRHDPALIMGAASSKGQDYAARLAARLEASCASDCISFRIDANGALLAVRPMCGDQVHGTVMLQGSGPYVLTLRPGVAGFGKGTPNRRIEVERCTLHVDPASVPVRVVEFIPADPATVSIAEAEVIVAGGAGVGGSENWARIEELAKALNGSVGASRIAVDRGWSPYARQVGQSGKTVKAKLYIACGISGASQHLSGMQDCETIIAINVDKTAPLMKLAHLGAVGNLHAVIPALVDQLNAGQRR